MSHITTFLLLLLLPTLTNTDAEPRKAKSLAALGGVELIVLRGCSKISTFNNSTVTGLKYDQIFSYLAANHYRAPGFVLLNFQFY